METEYAALATCAKEATGMETFIAELNVSELFSKTCKLRCDNWAAIDFSRNRIEKGHTKHIDIAYHLVREKLDKGTFILTYVLSNENLADIMTKPLQRITHKESIKRLGFIKVGDCRSL